MDSGRVSVTGRPRTPITRARSSRRRSRTWSRTRSKRLMPDRICSSGAGGSWTIGRRISKNAGHRFLRQAGAAPACDRDSGLRSQPILRIRSQRWPLGNPDERGSDRALDRHRAAAPAIPAVNREPPPRFSALERQRRRALLVKLSLAGRLITVGFRAGEWIDFYNTERPHSALMARVENAAFHYKCIIGYYLGVRTLGGWMSEVLLTCNLLNAMTDMGSSDLYATGR